MKKISSFHALLGLNLKESRVFSALSDQSGTNLALIVTEANLPRTTVASILSRLRKRKLVMSFKKAGKHATWKRVGISVIDKIVQNLHDEADVPGVSSPDPFTSLALSANTQVDTYKGVNTILEKIKEIMSEEKGSRILGYQSVGSVNYLRANLSKETIDGFNLLATRYKIITELVLDESTLRSYQKLANEDSDWSEKLKKRMLDLRVIPDGPLTNLGIDLNMYTNIVVVVNWQEETLLIIRDKEIVRLLKAMFEAMLLSAKKINHIESFK